MARRSRVVTPPDAGYVTSLYHLRINDGDEVNLRWLSNQFRLLCDLKYEVKVPEQYKAITTVIRSPFIRDAWHRITAALVQKPPIPHIEPKDQTGDSKRAASIAERWDVAAMETMTRDTQTDVIYEDTKALVRDGESVLKVVHRPEAWANFPRRNKDETAQDYLSRTDDYARGAALPIAWRSVDRLSMLFGNGEYGDDWALEFGEYPRPYLGRRYTMVESDDGYLIDPRVKLGGMPHPEGKLLSATGRSIKIEYWDGDWWAVVIDGTMAPGFPRPNPYGPRLPYFRSKAPDSQSMLYSLLHLVPAFDALMTMKLNWAYLSAFPIPIIETVPNALAPGLDLPTGNDGMPSQITLKPGKVTELPAGRAIRYLEAPPAGRDLNEMAANLRSLIDVAGIPSVLRGTSGGSGESGYLAAQLIAAANLAYKIAVTAQERKFARALDFIHYLIDEKIKQPVYVLGADDSGARWLGLRPSGKSLTTTEAPVDMLGQISVRFQPTLPTDEQARAMIALQLVNAPKPLLSRETSLQRFLQVEDPEAEADRIYVEQAIDHDPQIQQQVTEAALRAAGLLAGPAPAQQLYGPNGQPLLGPGGLGSPSPFTPGQAASGQPAVPGLTVPIQPTPQRGRGVPGAPGGRAAGEFPGRPGGVPGGQPQL